MLVTVSAVLEQYVQEVRKIYGKHLRSVILYGSYARGDFKSDSDIDIMILVDLTDLELEKYRKQLSWITYDFNEEYDTDIKPIAKNDAHFKKWIGTYPFYTNVQKEGGKTVWNGLKAGVLMIWYIIVLKQQRVTCSRRISC